MPSVRSVILHPFVRILEAGLWCVALLCAGTVLTQTVKAHATRQQADAIRPEPQNGHTTTDVRVRRSVTGKLTIPAIGLSVPVLNDSDPNALRVGVEHVRGSAVPGGLGNLVLAGHRDTFFRPLRHVKAGMQVRVTTTEGHWSYEIDSTEIVTPDQVGVLDIGERPEMTLITCYPFDFIGAAPKRFIVHAHLLSAEPTA